VICTTSQGINAHVWVHAGTGDNVTIFLKDGGGVTLDTATFVPGSPAGYDKTAPNQGSSSFTWYRYALTHDGSPARANANCYLYIVRQAVDASAGVTFYVDGALIGLDISQPDCWMSSRHIDNRNDYQTTSQATENYLNYIDVWGIPGDAPALARWKLAATANTGGEIYVGREHDGNTHLSSQTTHWLESEDLDTKQAEWATQVDATTTDGEYEQYTSVDGTASFLYWLFTGAAARRILRGPRRVFVRAKCNDASGVGNFKIETGLSEKYTQTGQSVTLRNSASWALTDLGLISFQETIPEESDDPTEPTLLIYFNAQIDATKTVDMDAILLIPTEEYLTTNISGGFLSATSEVHWIDGVQEKVIFEGVTQSSRLGTLWKLVPGNICNRVVFAWTENGLHTLANAQSVTVDIIPRTRHLMGT
jgi:hypothetical protein